MIAWHFTPAKNLDSIKANGLTVGHGLNWNCSRLTNNSKGRLFFLNARNLEQINFWKAEYIRKYGDGHIDEIQFEIPFVWCKRDPCSRAYYTTESIPPNKIKIITNP